jgi:pseudouridine synthase
MPLGPAAGRIRGESEMARQRLQKVLAAAGLASRRGAEDLIRAGRVTVDGRPAILGEQVDPDMQSVLVDGQELPSLDTPRHYWAVNKPAGVVSTVRDRHAGRTVMQLLPASARRAARLYPVGRLDEDSEGLLLLTNDGGWADLLLHPRYGVEREYMVGLARSLTRQQKAELEAGVRLDEGLAGLDLLEDPTPAQVRKMLALLEPREEDLRWYRVVLAQGWKRQIRRMFEAVGAPVVRLARIRVGTFKLTDLRAGEARQLQRGEARQLASTARRATTTRPSKAGLPAVSAGPVAEPETTPAPAGKTVSEDPEPAR